MARLRIAIAGFGLMGREHARLIRRHPDTELVGVADPAPDAAAAVAAFDVPHFADYREMMDATKPDGVVVALPNHLHLEAGLEVVKRKIPLFMEKPVTATIAEGLKLVEAAEAAGVPMMVGHHRRHASDIHQARQIIESGRLGRILAVNGLWLTKKPLDYFNTTWRREPGGGPLLINLIHDIDVLRYLCGDIESVQAVSNNSARGFAVEDTAAVIFKFESGALGSFLLSDAVPSPYVWDMAAKQALYLAHQPGDCYVIGGERGTLAVPTLHVWTHENDGDWRDPLQRTHLGGLQHDCYLAQVDDLVSVIRSGSKPVVDGMDGLRTLATVAAVAKAADRGAAVTVAEMLTPEADS